MTCNAHATVRKGKKKGGRMFSTRRQLHASRGNEKEVRQRESCLLTNKLRQKKKLKEGIVAEIFQPGSEKEDLRRWGTMGA